MPLTKIKDQQIYIYNDIRHLNKTLTDIWFCFTKISVLPDDSEHLQDIRLLLFVDIFLEYLCTHLPNGREFKIYRYKKLDFIFM